jgi:hypothetical protein
MSTVPCPTGTNLLTVFCSLRQEKRLINRKVTGLDDLVQELPLPAGKSEMQEHVNIPATGSEIRELSGMFVFFQTHWLQS